MGWTETGPRDLQAHSGQRLNTPDLLNISTGIVNLLRNGSAQEKLKWARARKKNLEGWTVDENARLG